MCGICTKHFKPTGQNVRYTTIYIIIITMFMLACCAGTMSNNDIQTIEGIAQRSKAGLVVDGVMIIDAGEDMVEKYAGKRVRVKGVISKDHPWQIPENNEDKNVPIRQGFNMPVMTEVLEITVLNN